jgi:hypothetical protein
MRWLSIVLLMSLFASLAPAAASERLVTDFSDGSLLGQIESTRALQQAFDDHETQLADAGAQIGLTPDQFRAVRVAVAAGRARYVELPQHIDAMTGEHDGHIFVVRNIRIPPRVFGWEVDLDEPGDVVKVYVPNRCGNISVVRERSQVLAAAPVYHVDSPPAGLAYGPFAPGPSALPVPESSPDVAYAPSLSTPAEAVQAATHHFAFLPFLLGGLLVGFLSSGGHGTGVTIGAHPTPVPIVTPAPTPTPVSCPTKTGRRIPR